MLIPIIWYDFKNQAILYWRGPLMTTMIFYLMLQVTTVLLCYLFI
jgi:hypothetical protein